MRAADLWLACVALVEDPAQRDATFFREAVKDITRNGHKLMELLVTRSPRERAGPPALAPGAYVPLPRPHLTTACPRLSRLPTAIDQVYFNRYGKTMEDELLTASNTNLRKTLLKLGRCLSPPPPHPNPLGCCSVLTLLFVCH
jgi:hypothetical protein